MLATIAEKAGRLAVAWVTRNLIRFRPYLTAELTADSIKALSELAILYSFLKDVGSDGEDSEVQDTIVPWESFLVEQCNTPKYAQMARKRPGQAFYLLMPYLALRRTGYRSPYHERTLDLLRRWRYPEAIEVVPHRLLDREYFLWKAGCLDSEPDWIRQYEATSLRYMTHPQYLDDEGAYVFTHTLFYLTDFGRHKPPLPSVELKHLIQLGEYLVIHNWRHRQWDILGELLVGLRGLERQRSRIYVDAANAFCETQHEDGSVPPGQDRKISNSHPSEDSEDLRFRHRYHTTFVMALFAFAHLHS